MSEIQGRVPYHNAVTIGGRRSTDWETLRLLVTRNSTPNLTVALIEQPRHGHPRLDLYARGLQVPWDRWVDVPDLRYYALERALAAVTQTRR